MKRLKNFLIIFLFLGVFNPVFSADITPIPHNITLPEKYTQDYIEDLALEYKNITDSELIMVALDMMKDTQADYSRKAILGYNLTQKPIKIEFKDLSQLNENYSSYDAVGWKKRHRLYIYINPKHDNAPPAALAALLSHEALHQDEYNSLSEETYAWTMEANVWNEMIRIYPESNDFDSPLVSRENTLKQLLEKGRYTNKYIKQVVYSKEAYRNLPLTSPGFSAE